MLTQMMARSLNHLSSSLSLTTAIPKTVKPAHIQWHPRSIACLGQDTRERSACMYDRV